jgi:hypothetical protein
MSGLYISVWELPFGCASVRDINNGIILEIGSH